MTNSIGLDLSKLWELVEDRGTKNAAVHGMARVWQDLGTEQQLPPPLFKYKDDVENEN